MLYSMIACTGPERLAMINGPSKIFSFTRNRCRDNQSIKSLNKLYASNNESFIPVRCPPEQNDGLVRH